MVLLAMGTACGPRHDDEVDGGTHAAGRRAAGGTGGAGSGGACGITAGGAPGMAGESPTDGQAGEGGGTGADEQRGFGQISVLSLPGFSGFDGTYAAASFWPPNGGVRCSLTQHGDCSLATCSSTPSVPLEDSGPIYLVSGCAGYHEVLYAAGGSYTSHVESGVYLAEGDWLSVGAGGHTAPRFYVSGTSPPPPDANRGVGDQGGRRQAVSFVHRFPISTATVQIRKHS